MSSLPINQVIVLAKTLTLILRELPLYGFFLKGEHVRFPLSKRKLSCFVSRHIQQECFMKEGPSGQLSFIIKNNNLPFFTYTLSQGNVFKLKIYLYFVNLACVVLASSSTVGKPEQRTFRNGPCQGVGKVNVNGS